MSLFTNNYSVL